MRIAVFGFLIRGTAAKFAHPMDQVSRMCFLSLGLLRLSHASSLPPSFRLLFRSCGT
jgi:hypothetical protein